MVAARDKQAKKEVLKKGETSFTAISNVLPKIQKAAQKMLGNCRVLGVVRIDNIITIEHIYGAKIAAKISHHLQQALQTCLSAKHVLAQVGISEHIFITQCEDVPTLLNQINSCFESLRLNCLYQDGVFMYPIMAFGYTELKEEMTYAQAIDQAFLSMHSDHKFRHNVTMEVKAREISKHDNMRKAGYFYKACLEGRICLAFQPVVHSKSLAIAHYECLLRIITEDGEIISAGPFIEAAEEFGFAVFVDKLVFRMAIEELNRDATVHLAVNCSSLSMYGDDWLNLANSLISDEKIASRLTVEITETSSRRDLKVMAQFVEHLKSFGCTVALDDFGAGYTSFAQLKVLNIDEIKIDGLFIKDLLTNEDSRIFVKLLLEFSSTYGIKTVAEFVETKELADKLTELGVDYLQGYHFGMAKTSR